MFTSIKKILCHTIGAILCITAGVLIVAVVGVILLCPLIYPVVFPLCAKHLGKQRQRHYDYCAADDGTWFNERIEQELRCLRFAKALDAERRRAELFNEVE